MIQQKSKSMETENETNPVGRPTKYDESKNDDVYRLCLLGATDDEIADFLEIARTTVYEWKKMFPEFADAILRGKSLADGLVAESLFNSARSGDTSASKFWLNNRRPQNWREKTEQKITIGSEQVFKIGDTEIRFDS